MREGLAAPCDRNDEGDVHGNEPTAQLASVRRDAWVDPRDGDPLRRSFLRLVPGTSRSHRAPRHRPWTRRTSTSFRASRETSADGPFASRGSVRTLSRQILPRTVLPRGSLSHPPGFTTGSQPKGRVGRTSAWRVSRRWMARCCDMGADRATSRSRAARIHATW